MSALLLELQNATQHRPLPAQADFECWVQAALRSQEAAELTIRLVDTEESRQLNHQYRDKDYATNVLSFEADLPPEIDLPLLGDIVICAPVVEREAKEQGKSAMDHWAHLTVHGVLHLLGMDHQQPIEAETMEALEVAVLAELGVANPYD